MKNKLFLTTVIVFLSLFFMVHPVYALGITPARTTHDFIPNGNIQGSFYILNTEHKQFNALVTIKGTFNKSVTIEKSLLKFEESDNSKEVKYQVHFPPEFDEPGMHEEEIIVLELPGNIESGGASVGAIPSVAHQIRVNIPYPGKFAKIDLRISEAKVGEKITFFIPVDNLGSQDIVSAKASVDILGPTNEKIKTVETDEKSIKASERSELIGTWDSKVNAGKYYAVALLNYDGKLTRAEKIFNVGDESLDLLGVEVKDFKLGGIAKLNILVENNWNQDLQDVFAEVFVLNERGDTITQVKSASTEVKTLQKQNLEAFWDTAGVKEGKYDLRVILHYNGKTTEKQLKAFLTLNAFKTEFLGITAEAVGISGFKKESLLMFLVIFLIAINVTWFVYFKKREKRLQVNA